MKQLRRGLCHACYERDRRAGKITSLVGSAHAYGAINRLRAAGWNYREISRAAGIDRSLIAHIVNGRPQINAKTSQAICTIDPGDRKRHRVNRCGWDIWPRGRRRLGVMVGNLIVCCGDCENAPCRCPDAADDFDVLWLGRLADHDVLPTTAPLPRCLVEAA